MKIVAKGVGNADPFYLAEGGRSGPMGFRKGNQTIEDIATGIRWPEIEIHDRENEQNVYSFTVEREHATPAASEEYLLRHELKLPRKASVSFQSEDGGSSTTWLNNAFIRNTEASYSGCTTIHTYQIIGGRMSLNYLEATE
jgi:hypothetical protein